MSPSRLFWLSLLLGLLGALGGGLLSTPPTDAADPTSFRTVEGGIGPDPRWLDLVRAVRPIPASGIAPRNLRPATLHVHLTDRTVAGRVSSPAAVSLQVTRGGITLASVTVQPVPDGDGYLYAAPLVWAPYPGGCGGACGCGALEPGDRVWMTQGSTALSLTIPPLKAWADGATTAVFGTSPPSDPLILYLYPRRDPALVLTRTVVAGADGTYQAPWADLRPGDTGFVAWSAGPDRAAYVRFVAPFLQVQVEGWEIAGRAAPCSTVWITGTDAAGNFPFNHWVSTDANGEFLVWSGEYGPAVPTHSPGQRVEASAAGQVFSTSVLPVTARADRDGGQVVGEAPADAPVRVEVFQGPVEWGREPIGYRWPYLSARISATAEGVYTAPLPLASADFGAAFVTGPDGHETYVRFAVPYLRVLLGRERFWYESRLQGQVDGTNIPLTLTLRNPAGLIKDIRSLRSTGNGFFRDLESESDPVLESGDALTVETARGVPVALTLPVLTARADPLSDTVSGEAPPGTRVTVHIREAQAFFESPAGGTPPPPQGVGPAGGGGTPPPPPLWATQVVTAGADGVYTADFRGRADLTRHSVGEVSLTTPEGHTVIRLFRARNCRPVLTQVFVGGNYLSGISDVGCPAVTIRLRDPAGYPKAEGYADFSGWDSFWFYFYLPTACPWPGDCYDASRPIFILPGDWIEIESGGAVFTTTVPTLTLEVDVAAPALYGQAPAGETLHGAIYDDSLEARSVFTATVTPQGRYTVSLTGIYTPAAGDGIYVWWRSGETNFYGYDTIPRLEAFLFDTYLYGYLHPLVPYTVTPLLVTGYAGPEGSFGAFVNPLVPGETVTVTTPREELTLTLPWLTARVERSPATVSGEAPPNAPLRVTLFLPEETWASRRVTATAAGTYTVSFPELAPLSGAQGILQYTHPQGHRVFLRFGTRAWNVTLGERCTGGYADLAGAPVTATLRKADGTTERIAGTASLSDASFSVCFSRSVEAGDRLTLTQAGREMAFTVPRLTAAHDWAAQLLEGEAPSGRLVQVTIHRGYWNAPTRRTLADEAGFYRLDTRDLNLRVGEPGRVRITDAAGNAVQLAFIVRGYTFYLPVVWRSGGAD